MIEAYNSGALSIEELFAELVTFTQDLNEEEQRHLREQISEEELAVFDILTRPGSHAAGDRGDQEGVQGPAGEVEDRKAGARVADETHDARRGESRDREDAGCRVAGEIHGRAIRTEVRGAVPACVGEVSGSGNERV